MLNILFPVLFFLGASAVLVASARSDWKGMTIPNRYPLILIALWVPACVLWYIDASWLNVKLLPSLAGAAAVFIVTIALYVGRAMGGGDTKLASAVALLIGIGFLDVFLLVMAFSGGFLAAYALLTRKYPDKLLPQAPVPGTWLAQLKEGKNKVPYGLAIAAGGIAALGAKWVLPLLS